MPNGLRTPLRYARIQGMNRDEACTARAELSGMPDGLAAALGELDEARADVAIRNWEETGEKGRSHYSAYIGVARTRRGGRRRGAVAAQYLIDPHSAGVTAAAS